MPAGISNFAAPLENCYDYQIGKDQPAFRILQKNCLAMTLPMLDMCHINGNDSPDDTKVNDDKMTPRNCYTKCKSNTDYAKRKMISRSNDHLVLASLQNHQSNPLRKKQQSKSHDNLNDKINRSVTETINNNNNINSSSNRQSAMTLSTEDFNQVLNAKLRKIQETNDDHENRRGCNKKNFISGRKPFITTVKTGEFLMPPPEVAALLGMAPKGDWIGSYDQQDSAESETNGLLPRSKFRSLISLARRPEVRHTSHNARCPTAIKATIDFAANLAYSATNDNNIGTTINSSSRPNEGRLRRLNRFPKTENVFTKTLRALPKKLEPIEGMMSMLLSPGDQQLPFGNLMFDRRVIRGSTFASSPTLIDGEQSQAARQAEAKRKQVARKRAQCQAARSMIMRIGSPPPVPGRKHEPVQTELYLEELYDKHEESEVGTQTDYFLDRPSTPLYCPGKVGQDAETQIQPGDLFDYDVEVQPILEVLVGKTIEQALIEVLEEEELAALREQQRRFLELRAAEKAEQQRLEEQERRLREEKCRRVKQHEEALKTQQETEERVAAAVLLTGYIAELLPAVLEGLKMSGFLLDEIKSDVEEGFMPWLMKEVKKEMGSMIESRELLMEIIREILENRAQTYTRLGQEYDEARDRMEDADDGRENAIPTQEDGGTRDGHFVDYQPPVVDAEGIDAL